PEARGSFFSVSSSQLPRRPIMSMRITSIRLLICTLVAMTASRATAADILYNFDNPGDTSSTVIDSHTADGSQNGGFTYAASAPVAGVGVNGTAGNYFAPQTSYAYKDIRTGANVAYSTAITWSAAINQTEASVDGYMTLFWTGADTRGTGETSFYFNPNGSLTSAQSKNWNVTTT